MRVLRISGKQELKQIMRDIGVDPYGIKIMLPKAYLPGQAEFPIQYRSQYT